MADIVREQFREHPFGTTLGLWGSILIGTGAYLYNRKIPFQLKVIQARILAQAGLITGVCVIGAANYLAQEETHRPASSNWKIRNFDASPSSPVDGAQVASSLTNKEAEKLK
jgi:hypothetical protein